MQDVKSPKDVLKSVYAAVDEAAELLRDDTALLDVKFLGPLMDRSWWLFSHDTMWDLCPGARVRFHRWLQIPQPGAKGCDTGNHVKFFWNLIGVSLISSHLSEVSSDWVKRCGGTHKAGHQGVAHTHKGCKDINIFFWNTCRNKPFFWFILKRVESYFLAIVFERFPSLPCTARFIAVHHAVAHQAYFGPAELSDPRVWDEGAGCSNSPRRVSTPQRLPNESGSFLHF